MDISQATQLLGTSKPSQIVPNSQVVDALKSVGISVSPDGKSLATAQERLLTAMEESQKAAGHSGALLKAGDLGEAGARLSGELPASELRKILADSADGNWRFQQAPNNTLKAVEGSSRIITGIEGPTMSRADIANRVVNTYDQKVGMSVLDGTLAEAKSVALRQAEYGEKHVKAAWEAGESGAVSGAAKEAVDTAKVAGSLVPEEKILAEAAMEAAEKAGAKALGKTLAKSVPLLGAGVVFADVASAAEDTYQSAKSGNYHDAAIDATRMVSKAGFGIAGQAASPTIVGGLAINAAGESADIALQSLKSEKEASSVNQNDVRTETFKNAIHNTEASKGELHAKTLAENPDLQKPITAYGLIKQEVTKDGGLNERNQQILSQVEGNMSNLIQEDRVSEIKLPSIIETRTATAEHTAPEHTRS